MNGIKLLIIDVDGTLTDGKIYMSNDGELFKVFDVKDGSGIHDILPGLGIIPIVLTARHSIITERRCQELGIAYCYQSVRDKARKLRELAMQFGLEADAKGVYSEIAYMGDDIVDLCCMALCGTVGCPKDAAREVIAIADFVSTRRGGDGAVREFIEYICDRVLHKVGK